MRVRSRPHPLLRLDLRLFDLVAKRHTTWLDRALPALSRAADHSKLWALCAALLAALGGRRGQRAALRGVGSILLTSPLVNLLLKPVVRRPRPELRRVPVARRLRTQPTTTSFPSGHAASAAAFATGVASEYPRAAVPLAALAGAVGYSRVYVGVHYPLDVAVGAATGIGFGLLTRALWPVLPAAVERERSTSSALRLPPNEDGDGVVLVVNSGAGPGGVDVDELRERLPRARITVVEDPAELPDVLREAAGSCEVLGICGGDGSTVTAAGVALDRELPLLLVPTGTLNHLGRDLRLECLDDALGALASGEAVSIDLGEVDGRPFVNGASFGAYTAMLEIRERLQKRIGRWPAHFAAVAVAIARAQPLHVRLDGVDRRVWMVFVGNCRHEPSGFAPSWRPELDDGMLDLRVLSGERPLARVRLFASILTGRLTHSAAYEQRCVRALEVESNGRPVSVALDGDMADGERKSLSIGKRRRSLVVYAPTKTA